MRDAVTCVGLNGTVQYCKWKGGLLQWAIQSLVFYLLIFFIFILSIHSSKPPTPSIEKMVNIICKLTLGPIILYWWFLASNHTVPTNNLLLTGVIPLGLRTTLYFYVQYSINRLLQNNKDNFQYLKHIAYLHSNFWAFSSIISLQLAFSCDHPDPTA